MKKKVLLVAALFVGATTFAQDGLTSKKGEAILPEAGDWAIGFDAAPLLNYAGNFFGKTAANNTDSVNWLGSNKGLALQGKYFKDESTAYRASFRVGFGGDSKDTYFGGANGDSLVNNLSNSNGFNLILGVGLEKRKGSTRIQGYYGGDFTFGLLGGGSTTNEYGVALDPTVVSGPRTLKVSNGNTFHIGLRGFIGVEYFFAPKLSIGAEYGYGLSMNNVGDSETTTESSNGTAVTEITVKTGNESNWRFDTDNRDGRINLTFHF